MVKGKTPPIPLSADSFASRLTSTPKRLLVWRLLFSKLKGGKSA